jgi:hypothetical protein
MNAALQIEVRPEGRGAVTLPLKLAPYATKLPVLH